MLPLNGLKPIELINIDFKPLQILGFNFRTMEKLTKSKDPSSHSSKDHTITESSNILDSSDSSIQQKLDQSLLVQKGKQIQSSIDNSPLQVTQRKRKESLFASDSNQKESQSQNHSSLPDHLKTSMETLSGYDLSDVKVHYNSNKPANLNAHAYAQGSDIHLASGQEKHLPHEAWHVVQQKQGRVNENVQMKGVQVNDSTELEQEATEMGAKANSGIIQKKKEKDLTKEDTGKGIVQRYGMDNAPYGDPQKDPNLKNLTAKSEKEKVADALKSKEPSDVKSIQDVNAASESERIELIKILVYQGWVGPFDEYKIEEIWKSFGSNEYKFRDANQKLFDDSINAGADLYTVDRNSPERSAWLGFFSHYLPKKFVNNYMDGLAAPITLSQQEMIDCNPIVDVRRSGEAKTIVGSLQAAGGGSKSVEFKQPSGALTNGTLGNFTITYKGTFTVKADGTWSFAGTMTFYDFWDFDPKPFATGGRSVQGELKTRAGHYLLRGLPFHIYSVAVPVSQSSSDAEAIWGSGASPVSVPDKAAGPLGKDLKEVK